MRMVRPERPKKCFVFLSRSVLKRQQWETNEIELVGDAWTRCCQVETWSSVRIACSREQWHVWVIAYWKHAVRFQRHYATCVVKQIGKDAYSSWVGGDSCVCSVRELAMRFASAWRAKKWVPAFSRDTCGRALWASYCGGHLQLPIAHASPFFACM